MPNCLICNTETNYQSTCGCNVCLSCIIKQFENTLSSNEEVMCPNEKCQYLYSLTNLKNECKEQPYKDQLESLLQNKQKSDLQPGFKFGHIKCSISLLALIMLSIHFLLSWLHSIGIFNYFILDKASSPMGCVQIFFIVNLLPIAIIFSGFYLFFLFISATKGKLLINRGKIWDLIFLISPLIVWFIFYQLLQYVNTWYHFNLLDSFLTLLLEIAIYGLYKNPLPDWLPLGFVAFQLFYFLGINGIFMATWLIPYWGDIVKGHKFIIASYVGLILMNTADICGLVMSYQFIIMIIIDLLSQKGKRHKYNILHKYLEYVGFREKR